MSYYDQATSDELKDKFKDSAVPTGDDYSGLISYFDKGLQGMDETTGTIDNTGLIKAPAFQSLQTQVNNSAVGTNLLTGTSSDLIVDDSSNTSQGWKRASIYNNLIVGSVYTFSSEVSVLGTATSIDVKSYNPTTGLTINDSYTTFPIVNGKISGLVKPIDGYTTLIIYAGNSGNTHGNKVTFHHMKLEKGSVATDWCLNPSEILTEDNPGKEFNALKNNLQNLVLSDRRRLTYKSASVSLTPNSGVQPPTADFEFKHLANMGVSATFVVMLNVTGKNDPNIQMPDDTIISNAISEATKVGVSVTMIKPHIGISFMDWLDRASYEPSDWTAFWTNWQNIMLHYAGICDANGIPILCLGCEQYNCTDASMMQQWGALTAAIRSKYPNLKLTYAANGTEYGDENRAQIAQYLDFMGVNFYPSYTYKLVQPGNAGGISIDELARAFYTDYPGHIGDGNTRTYHELVDFYQEKYNVQTFVTEIGVMPTDDGLAHLISDNTLSKASDPTQQTGLFDTPALAMEAFFNGLAQNPNIIGFAWWSVGYPFHFFNALGDSVAEDVMQKYVKGGLV